MMNPKTLPEDVIDAIDTWTGLAINAEYFRWRHDIHPPQLLDRPNQSIPVEFSTIAEDLICWCDSGGCSVDPGPIDRFCRMIRHIYGLRSFEICDVLGAVEITQPDLMKALEDAFQACRRMRVVATARLGIGGELVRKLDLKKRLDMGDTKFRQFLNSAISEGRIAEESRTSKYVELRDHELIAAYRASRANLA
jgi:hypothetical protein